MKYIIILIVSLAFMVSTSVPLKAAPKQDYDKERKTALSIAGNFYPAFMMQFSGRIPNIQEYIETSAPLIFKNAAVWYLNDGYIIYSPATPVAFFLIKERGGKWRFFGLAPSQILAMTEDARMEPSDSYVKLAYNVIPEDLQKIYERHKDEPAEANIPGIEKVSVDNEAIADEKLNMLAGAYIRSLEYQKCRTQLNWQKLESKIKSELANARMSDVIKDGMVYSDFVPISRNQSVLVMTNKEAGTFYTMTLVNTKGKCSAGDTIFKAF